jgi:hypothetical protein
MFKGDDGTTIGGVVMTLACIVCLVLGYTARDRGLIIRFQQDNSLEQVR